MKSSKFLVLLLIAALSGAAGWFAAKHWPARSATSGSATSSSRKILYYQSAMHPWIKSDQPGRCTICGMQLSPVYEGEQGFAAGEGIVTLGSNVTQVVNVQSQEAKRRALTRTLRVAGVIDDNDAKHRIVSAYVDGRIDKLSVNYVGAEVTAGQPLATFYSPMLLAAEREYVTLHQRFSAAPEGEGARIVSAAKERLKRLGLDDAAIQALAKKNENEISSEILSPVSGTVVARFVYEGQYVKEGEKLFEIADFSTMWFRFDAYERDLGWVKPGQKVEVTTPAVPGKSFAGTITFIDPNLNEMTRSAKVRVELPNPLVERDGRKVRELYHRLYADATVALEVPEVLTVARSAVLSPGSQPLVYVDKGNGAYEQRLVKLGRAGDDFWEVIDGVSEGERVVTTGNMLIDAQAQLNRRESPSAGTPASPPEPVVPEATTFTEAQQKSINEFLALAGAVAEALAADNLADFNQHAARVHQAMPALLDAVDQHKSWQPLVAKIEATSHLEKTKDLAAARKAFLPFSFAVVDFANRLRRQPEFAKVRIYQCPMVNQAVPGAPKVGQWMQLQAPLRNPYFGAEMLDCGTEVKP
jgi:membrane fusion protein, copper/silver efflux system